MALEQFERWQLEQELADDLRKAYRGNAQLRATKVELLQKIDAIDKRLAKNTKAQEVLDDPKYAELEIRFDDGFLRKIEEQAASNVLKKRKQKGSEEDSGAKDSKSTMDVEQKTVWLLEFLRKSDHENLTVAQITDELQKQGITKGSSATQWLAPLKLPQKSLPWVQSGNRRKGEVVPLVAFSRAKEANGGVWDKAAKERGLAKSRWNFLRVRQSQAFNEHG